MTIDEILNNLKNKDFSSKKLTSAEQLIRETTWTDFLQRLVHWGNAHMLESFRYGLKMEYDAGEQ